MILLRDNSPVYETCKGAVMALGNFDGLHLGHRAVIGAAIARARETGEPAGVLTFEPHPRRVFRPDLPFLRLQRVSDKLQGLRGMGVDVLRIVRFTPAFARTAAEDFVTKLLHGQLGVSHVVTGEDFTFGHNRGGNVESLAAMARRQGFSASICPAVEAEGERCSSTRLRAALAQGDVALAARLLGHFYVISGPVRHGDKRGRELGFPTANILPPPVFLPMNGIYAVRAKVRGKEAKGVASLGLRPNFPLARPLLEVYLFDWAEEIYGERMEVELLHFLRPEAKLDGIEALKRQMAEDAEMARSLLN